MPDKIIVIVMEPGKPAEQRSIDNTLKALQELVGGHIETVRLSHGRILLVNEEGVPLNLPANRAIVGGPGQWPIIQYGTIVMVRVIEDEFSSVYTDDMAWVENHCHMLESE